MGCILILIFSARPVGWLTSFGVGVMRCDSHTHGVARGVAWAPGPADEPDLVSLCAETRVLERSGCLHPIDSPIEIGEDT